VVVDVTAAHIPAWIGALAALAMVVTGVFSLPKAYVSLAESMITRSGRSDESRLSRLDRGYGSSTLSDPSARKDCPENTG